MDETGGLTAAWVRKRAPAPARRERALPAAGLAVAGLSLLAFCLRLAQIDQSLSGDELFTYRIVTIRGLGEVFQAVHDTSADVPRRPHSRHRVAVEAPAGHRGGSRARAETLRLRPDERGRGSVRVRVLAVERGRASELKRLEGAVNGQ
jgi:hypothetical protein